MFRFKLRTLLIILALGPPILGSLWAWTRLHTSNCGGNNAALSNVRASAMFVQVEAIQSVDGEFLVTTATPEQREYLATIAHSHWLPDCQFLVSTQPYRSQAASPPRVLFVCDRPFTNVPRYVFGQAPPTYAAAYSDGSVSLLTAAEFAALDRSSLVSLDEIVGQQVQLRPPQRQARNNR